MLFIGKTTKAHFPLVIRPQMFPKTDGCICQTYNPSTAKRYIFKELFSRRFPCTYLILVVQTAFFLPYAVLGGGGPISLFSSTAVNNNSPMTFHDEPFIHPLGSRRKYGRNFLEQCFSRFIFKTCSVLGMESRDLCLLGDSTPELQAQFFEFSSAT